VKDQIRNRPFEDLVTLSGQAKVIINSGNVESFCKNMNFINENYHTLYREIINISKELADKAEDFSSTFHSM
jgi:hypothetical protein